MVKVYKGWYFAVLMIFVGLTSWEQTQNGCNYERPHQADQWVFGDKVHLNFQQREVIPEQTFSFYDSPNGVAAISDNNGNLLLFSNGLKIWGKSYHVIENGDGLKGNNFATQPAIILPTPGKTDEYYVFTLDMYINPVFVDGVNYSIVKMNGNTGVVTSKNNTLFHENSQKVCAVKHSGGKDIWVIFHGFGENNGNKFYSYLLSDSLDLNPVISSVGSFHKGDPNNGAGYMKASPDGKKIALVIPSDGKVEIFDFDASSGQVSNPVSSNPGSFNFPFGVEFSPDNTKLYISTSPLGTDFNYLYQLDITQANPFENPVILKSFEVNDLAGADSLMGALQLAPDGKIYLAKFRRGVLGKNYLGVIYNPDRPGIAANYNILNHQNNNGLFLNGAGSLIGLPTFLSDYLNIPHFWAVNQCHHDTTLFIIRNLANIDDTEWDFDNPGGVQTGFDPYSPGFVYSDPGEYKVSLTEKYGDENYTFTTNINIHPLPYVDLGQGNDTIYILPGSSIRLDAGDYENYYWQPGGSTGRYLDVNTEGLYRATVTDSNCCVNSGEVFIKYANLQYPTAFKPQSSIVQNRTFKVTGNISALAEYNLKIYNRWGQLVFETDDPYEGWDGTLNGSDAEMGTYVWVSVFTSFESGIQAAIKVKNRGLVTLLR
jgi:gliding motility-associated-like protein